MAGKPETSKKPKESIFGNWKAALAVLAVLIFIFEIVAFGFIGGSGWSIFGNGDNAQAEKLGQVEFKGSIRTYEPILVVPVGRLRGSMFNDIRSMAGVKEVTDEAGNTVIQLETRDDVYPVAAELKKKNITTYSVANIAPPGVATVVLQGGDSINVSFGNVAVRVETEPIVPPDTQVTVTMVVSVLNGQITGYQGALIKTEENVIALRGKVQSELIVYTYSIPWSERNNVDVAALQQYGAVQYDKKNIGFFSSELTQQQIVLAKQFSYVTYIDKKSVVLEENFTDAAKAATDLGSNITFTQSTLTVRTNQTLDLNYTGSSRYAYVVKLEQSDYTVPEALQLITVESDSQLNATEVQLSVRGKFVGNVLIDMLEKNITAS
ncbi:MAG: hypothetical protein V1492_05390 [Candidatus Micrarchaeota archaeon]